MEHKTKWAMLHSHVSLLDGNRQYNGIGILLRHIWLESIVDLSNRLGFPLHTTELRPNLIFSKTCFWMLRSPYVNQYGGVLKCGFPNKNPSHWTIETSGSVSSVVLRDATENDHLRLVTQTSPETLLDSPGHDLGDAGGPLKITIWKPPNNE